MQPSSAVPAERIGVSAAQTSAGQAAPSWIHIVFSVADPDRTFKQLKSRGIDVTTRDRPINGPVTSFLLHDSEGNEIEILADTEPVPR